MKKKQNIFKSLKESQDFVTLKLYKKIYHWKKPAGGAEVERNKKLSNLHEKFWTKACALYDHVGKGEYIRPTDILISEIVKFVIRKGLFSSYLWQCPGSLTFWYGSGSGTTDRYHWITDPDHVLFFNGLQDDNNEKSFFSNYFCLLLTVGKFTQVIKNNKLLRSHKTIDIKVFLHFFACWWKHPDPYK